MLLGSIALSVQLALPFTDVSDRYEDSVNYLVENNISSGITTTQYGIELPIKRGDAVVMISKHLKLDHVRPQQINHTDVPERIRPEVNSLWERNIINEKDKFYPNNLATRGEISEWLYNAYTQNLDEMSYKEWITNVGILKGDPIRGMRWDETITRGEFSIILKRAFDIEGPYVDPFLK